MEFLRALLQAQVTKGVKAILDKMKRTVIGEERSVHTEIWFLFKDEFEALKRGIDAHK